MSFRRVTRLLRLGWGAGLDIPHVNIVKLQGVIATSAGGPRSPQSRRLINIERVDKWLVKAFSNSLRPAAVALCINSPGGSPVQSDLIHRRIRELAADTGIPVYTFAEDVAASGGYWLMCAGDELWALGSSIVGSIGVVGGGFGFVDLIKKVGVDRRIYTAGSEKALADPFRPEKPEEVQKLQTLLDDLHEGFKETVVAARGERLPRDTAQLFTGRPWTGRQALQLGLVDGTDDMRSVMRRKFGQQVLFRLCSEPPRPALGDALGLSIYDGVRDSAQAVLDEAQERVLLARCGL